MATRKHSRSHKHSRKNESKTRKSESRREEGKTMKKYCLGCRKEVMIHDVKEVEYKLKGHTRRRLEGKCEKGHKFFRNIKA